MSNALWKEEFGQVGAMLKVLADLDLQPSEFSEVIRRDPVRAGNLVAYCKAGMPALQPVSSVIDVPVYDARQVNALLLPLRYSEGQLAAFGPPPESLPGFITFFDPGWSIVRLRQYCSHEDREYQWGPRVFHREEKSGLTGCGFRSPSSDRDWWYEQRDFAKLEEAPCYRRIRMNAIEGSFGKTLSNQMTLLPPGEEVPLARQLVMGMALHYCLGKQRLFSSYYVNFGDKLEHGSVGFVHFDAKGIEMNRLATYENDHRSNVGMASAMSS